MTREIFYDALEKRTRRLTHLVEISAPAHMISTEIVLVIKAAMGYCPNETINAFTNWLITSHFNYNKIGESNETIKIGSYGNPH